MSFLKIVFGTDAVDPGRATIVSAGILLIGAFVNDTVWPLIFPSSLEKQLQTQTQRIAELEGENGLAGERDAHAVTSNKLSACREEAARLDATLAARNDQVESVSSELGKCKAELVDVQACFDERANWLRQAALLQNEVKSCKRSYFEALDQRNAARQSRDLLSAQIERNVDIELAYYSVLRHLERLLDEVETLSESSSVEALAAFERQLINRLRLINTFKADYVEVGRYFNEEMEEFLNILVERSTQGAGPLESETLRKWVTNLHDNAVDREKELSTALLNLIASQARLETE